MNDEELGESVPEELVWTKELVSKFWDGMAKAGLDDAMAFGQMAKRCIYWVVSKHLVEGGRHLDYGAGSGEVAKFLTTMGFPFAIYEPSAERASKALSSIMNENRFLGIETSKPNQSYDAVTCFEVLEHVLDEDLEEVTHTISEFVKPGGTLIISTPNNEDLARDTIYCPVSNVVFHRWQHVRQVTAQWLIERFEPLGFETVCVHELDFSEALFSPYLHHMNVDMTGFTGDKSTPLPTHVDRILRDESGRMGGGTRILYIAKKTV